MKPKAKDFHPTAKTESTLKLQDLDFVVEEIDDESAATLVGGGNRRNKETETRLYPTKYDPDKQYIYG